MPMRLMMFAALALISAPVAAAPIARAAIADPPRDARYPAKNQQLLIPSHGVGMNASLFEASGKVLTAPSS